MGRLVVKHTFLSYEVDESEDEQPACVKRSQTDSALFAPCSCMEYRPGSPSTVASSPWVSDDGNEACPGSPSEDAADVQLARRSLFTEPCTDHEASRPDARAETVAKRPRAADTRTTLMMRNLPNDYTREMLLQMLGDEGFGVAYDFVYLPIDFSRGCNLGYAFVNLVDAAYIPSFRATFDGYSTWGLRSSKVCRVTWSARDQGLRANVRRYRNSPVMHSSVPDSYKPCLFSDGVRVKFPAPHGQVQRPSRRRE